MTIDFSTPIQYLWALLPEVVLTAAALAVMVVDAFQPGPSRRAAGALTVAGLAAAAAANAWLLTLSEASPVAMVAIDGYRVFANFLFLGGAALTVAVAGGYLEREGIGRAEFYTLLLFATVGMMVMAGSRDLILIFLGFETMSIASYVLAGFHRRDPRSAEAALKYFLLGAFSSAFLLYGVALVFGAAGTTNLGLIRLSVGPGASVGLLWTAGLVLVGVGFAFKVAAVPFHMWAPDVYEGAPTPVTAFMAAVVKAAGFAAFVRVFAVGFGDLHASWVDGVRALAWITMIWANLVALQQTNVKRMLAYSSVAHAGYLLVALAAGNRSGMAAFLFYLIAYSAMTIGAFAIVQTLARRGDRRMDLKDYAGLGWSRPWPAALLALFLVSLAGFPPTGGFVAKVYVFRAAVEAGLTDLAVVLAITTVISYGYYLRVIVEMYMRGEETRAAAGAEPGAPDGFGRALTGALAVCAAVVLWTGLLPTRPLEWADRSVAPLLQSMPELGAAPVEKRMP